MDNPSARTFWEEINIQTLPGEELLLTGEPDRSAMFRAGMCSVLLLGLLTGGFLLCCLPVAWFVERRKARFHQHYVTNRRVIVVNGVIGYSIQSIPLNRVSDVTVACGLLQRVFGIRSVLVKDIASQTVFLQGLKTPFAIQELLLEQVRHQDPETESHAQEADDPEVIALLREIRDGLRRGEASGPGGVRSGRAQ